MKKQLFLFFIVCLLPSLGFAQIKGVDGRYELVESAAAAIPKANSLDNVHLIEIFSFTCPHCNRFNKELPAFKKKFGKKVMMSHYEVAWAGPNPGKLYYHAVKQNKGDKTKDFIFRAYHDSGINRINDPKNISLFSRYLKIQDPQAVFDSDALAAELEKGKKYAKDMGVKSTPTVIIEGIIRVPGNDVANLTTIVNSLLKEPVK